MRAKRVDQNQKDVVKALRGMGVSVFHLHEVGKGCPDLLCGINNKTFLVEVKADEKATFTPAQIEFQKAWKGEPVVRINNVDEAIAFIKFMV